MNLVLEKIDFSIGITGYGTELVAVAGHLSKSSVCLVNAVENSLVATFVEQYVLNTIEYTGSSVVGHTAKRVARIAVGIGVVVDVYNIACGEVDSCKCHYIIISLLIIICNKRKILVTNRCRTFNTIDTCKVEIGSYCQLFVSIYSINIERGCLTAKRR